MDYLRQTSDGSFEVRVTVPEHLRPIMMKKNLTKRLGTKSKAEAKRRAAEHVQEFRRLLADAELGRGSRPTTIDIMAAVSAIDRWANAERRRVLPQTYATGEIVPLSVNFSWRDSWRSLEGGYAPAKVMMDPQDTALIAALHSQGFSFPAGTSIPSSIRSEFARTCGRLEHEAEVTRGGGREYLDRLGETPKLTSTPAQGNAVLPTVSKALEVWRSNRETGGKDAGKTAREFETQINRFIDVHGDVSLSVVTTTQCIEFRDLMSHYPARPTTQQRQQPIREVVQTLKASGAVYSPLKPKTLNDTVLAAIKAVFGYALQGTGRPNPMAGVAVIEPATHEPSRLPYSDDDLSKLFATGPFRGSLINDDNAAGEAQKWAPLLSLFTGARLEEIAQLAVADIKSEGQLHFIQFQERYSEADPGFRRSLKNASSHRQVPIHSTLISLGFLTFVQQRRSEGQVHLFPQMKWDERKKRDKSYKVSQRFTNWWSEFSRTIVPDPQKSFHSFRHTVTERLRNAGVAEALNDALTGHATPGQGQKYGRSRNGTRYALPVLAEAIEKLTYPTIDFGSIR